MSEVCCGCLLVALGILGRVCYRQYSRLRRCACRATNWRRGMDMSWWLYPRRKIELACAAPPPPLSPSSSFHVCLRSHLPCLSCHCCSPSTRATAHRLLNIAAPIPFPFSVHPAPLALSPAYRQHRWWNACPCTSRSRQGRACARRSGSRS